MSLVIASMNVKKIERKIEGKRITIVLEIKNIDSFFISFKKFIKEYYNI